ncbi:hypothetical protein ACFLWR_04705 [Chloroflexota bacterium]
MVKNETGKKAYRVVQSPGKISFMVEELWDGGIERGPFGSKQYAINSEEKIARENGFIDDLVVQEIIEEKLPPTEAFELDSSGTWHCKHSCSIEIENKEITFTSGATFTKGIPFMGVDVVKWLEDNS